MPHLHTEITEELNADLNRLIPVGVKKKVVEIVMRQLVAVLEGPDGKYALGAILQEYLNVVEAFIPKDVS